MHAFTRLAIAAACITWLGTLSLPAAAATDVATQLTEARQEGSIWTALALNRHLSPFKIAVNVDHGAARLTGTVENQVDRDLAEQIAMSIAGIDSVDNQLQVDPALTPADPDTAATGAEPSLSQRFDDATLTATIKSKLLWNASTQALDISVDSQQGVVTLKGHVQQAEARDLAGRIARTTDGVTRINNLIVLSSDPSTVDKAKVTAGNAQAALSDAWIAGKVKASLVTSRNLDGFDIKVASNDGMVSLSGAVATTEEKAQAVEVARTIRGVRGVDADLLKAGS